MHCMFQIFSYIWFWSSSPTESNGSGSIKPLSDDLQIWGTEPQSIKLRVLLLLLMINDLSTPTPIFKYVDDMMLYTITNNSESHVLQDAVNDVSWLKRNNTKINKSKTKIIMVCFNNNPPEVKPIHVGGVLLGRGELCEHPRTENH